VSFAGRAGAGVEGGLGGEGGDAGVLRVLRARVRRAALARRDALAPAARARLSRRIARRVAALPEFRRASTVMAYATFRSEVDTAPLIAAALAKKKRVLLPRTVVEGRALEPREFAPGALLVAGAYGIPEPPPDAPRADPADIDLVIVPGACFDEGGNRLGYGGGYYDRFLPRAGRAATVGVAFEAQVVPAVPPAEHDVPLGAVVTERRVIRPAGASQATGAKRAAGAPQGWLARARWLVRGRGARAR